MEPKVYLGDGVYCRRDGSDFILTTENGIEETNTIFLEPEVLVAFLHYLSKIINIEGLLRD